MLDIESIKIICYYLLNSARTNGSRDQYLDLVEKITKQYGNLQLDFDELIWKDKLCLGFRIKTIHSRSFSLESICNIMIFKPDLILEANVDGEDFASWFSTHSGPNLQSQSMWSDLLVLMRLIIKYRTHMFQVFGTKWMKQEIALKNKDKLKEFIEHYQQEFIPAIKLINLYSTKKANDISKEFIKLLDLDIYLQDELQRSYKFYEPNLTVFVDFGMEPNDLIFDVNRMFFHSHLWAYVQVLETMKLNKKFLEDICVRLEYHSDLRFNYGRRSITDKFLKMIFWDHDYEIVSKKTIIKAIYLADSEVILLELIPQINPTNKLLNLAINLGKFQIVKYLIDNTKLKMKPIKSKITLEDCSRSHDKLQTWIRKRLSDGLPLILDENPETFHDINHFVKRLMKSNLANIVNDILVKHPECLRLPKLSKTILIEAVIYSQNELIELLLDLQEEPIILDHLPYRWTYFREPYIDMIFYHYPQLRLCELSQKVIFPKMDPVSYYKVLEYYHHRSSEVYEFVRRVF